MWVNGYSIQSSVTDPEIKKVCHLQSVTVLFFASYEALQSELGGKIVAHCPTSAQWALQMAHASKIAPCSEGRLVITDNFYTSHNLVSQLKKITDNEVLTLSIVVSTTLIAVIVLLSKRLFLC